jgi:ribosomal protein S18 acetylase RimI-like enzyme
MDGEYHIEYVENPEQTAWSIIGHGLQDYNTRHAGDTNFKRLCFALYSPDGTIEGGLFGSTYWDWLYIDLLWVKDELRGSGHGQSLLELAEEEARRRGVKHAYLDTFSFQAPGFYKKYGYRVFGELQDFPPGHTRYFLTKDL